MKSKKNWIGRVVRVEGLIKVVMEGRMKIRELEEDLGLVWLTLLCKKIAENLFGSRLFVCRDKEKGRILKEMDYLDAEDLLIDSRINDNDYEFAAALHSKFSVFN